MTPTQGDARDQPLSDRQRLVTLLREMIAARAPVEPEWVGPRELRAIRRHMGWTQTDLANHVNKAIGTTYRQTDISQYERGVRPNNALLRDLTTFFGAYE